jgi:hypothetical protein
MDCARRKGIEEALESKISVKVIAKAMKRTPAAVRQKAMSLGISIGHRR